MKQWAGRIGLVLVCAGAGFGGKLVYDVTQHLLEDHRNHHAVLDWANKIVQAEQARQGKVTEVPEIPDPTVSARKAK